MLLGQEVSYAIGTPFEPILPLAPKLFQAQPRTVMLPVGHITLAAHLEYRLVSHLREHLPWVPLGKELDIITMVTKSPKNQMPFCD